MRCGICNWWKDGVCHKYPPKVVTVSDNNPYVNTNALVVSTEWPATYENDYCGEFEKVD